MGEGVHADRRVRDILEESAKRIAALLESGHDTDADDLRREFDVVAESARSHAELLDMTLPQALAYSKGVDVSRVLEGGGNAILTAALLALATSAHVAPSKNSTQSRALVAADPMAPYLSFGTSYISLGAPSDALSYKGDLAVALQPIDSVAAYVESPQTPEEFSGKSAEESTAAANAPDSIEAPAEAPKDTPAEAPRTEPAEADEDTHEVAPADTPSAPVSKSAVPAEPKPSVSQQAESNPRNEAEEEAFLRQHSISRFFGTAAAAEAALRDSVSRSSTFSGHVVTTMLGFKSSIEKTHITLSNLRKALASVVRSATRNEKMEAGDMTRVATELDASRADVQEIQRLTSAIAAVRAKPADIEALAECFESAAALFEWEIDERAQYNRLLTRARLETVATFMENDAEFRNQFSPAVLASLHDANNAYRSAMVTVRKAADDVLALCASQSPSQQGWLRARQEATVMRGFCVHQLGHSASGFPMETKYRIAYSTVEKNSADVSLCDSSKFNKFSSCYTEYTDAPIPPEFSSAREQVLYYAEQQFPRSPKVSTHFSAPSSTQASVPLNEFLKTCSQSELSYVLFQLTYSLAGMYSVMGLQLHCFSERSDLSKVAVYKDAHSSSSIFSMVNAHGRKDWDLPMGAPVVHIQCDFDKASWWLPRAPPAQKRFVEAAKSGADLRDLLFAMLQSESNPAALNAAAADSHSALHTAYVLASECFPASLAARFQSSATKRADLSIVQCLSSTVFSPIVQSFPSTTELPLCIWSAR